MEGRWCSAAEVAAAVSRAGGGAAPRDLAHACLAWGARPAPLILTEPEPEGELPPLERGAPPPDLRGITRMLRMVQNEDSDEDPPSPDDGPLVISRPGCPPCMPGSPCAHLVIDHANKRDVTTSALNPNVAEFVPRSAPPARAPSEGAAGSSARVREELAARLRDDISGGRDRCSAIARLMRLYAEPAPAPRLLTPGYFELPAAPELAPQRPTSDEERGGYTPEKGSVEAQCGQPEAASDVRASVDKVRRWLEKEESPRTAPAPARASPNLLLSPVTFRPRTPAPFARTPPPPPQPAAVPATRAYSPPARATAALHREYAARAAQAAALPSPAAPDTLWTRLQTQLRHKEAEQRARAAAAAADEP